MEAVDPVFQAKMLDMLKQTGRPEMVVGWYHSHPGFGCWLSGNLSTVGSLYNKEAVVAKHFCIDINDRRKNNLLVLTDLVVRIFFTCKLIHKKM